MFCTLHLNIYILCTLQEVYICYTVFDIVQSVEIANFGTCPSTSQWPTCTCSHKIN